MKNIAGKLVFCAIVGCGLLLACTARATIIWSEDFSNVSDWTVIADPGGGSTITSDGNLGLLYVNAANNQAAFGPQTGVAPFVPFDPNYKASYTMGFTVAAITYSTSYDIALDEFNSGGNYIGTVWQVFPTASTSTFVGSTSVSLGAFTYTAGTTYLMPKITVHTGDPAQTVSFDNLQFDLAVPEPSVVALLAVGLGMVWQRRRHR